MGKKTSNKKSGGKTRGNGAVQAAASALPVTQTPSPLHAAPSSTDVSARAHEIWIARGKPTPGTPLEDWLQAERELKLPKKS